MESTPQSKILTYFKYLGAWAFKTLASSRNGTPDIIACIPITQAEAEKLFKQQKTIGLFVAVEVKDVDKKAVGRKLQETQLDKIRQAGGIGLVATSKDAVKKELSRFRI